MFVTGHASREASPASGAGGAPLHWPTLAAAAAEGITLVIYMGIATVESLQAGLLAGLQHDTPVVVVQHASLPEQRHVVCQLGGLVAAVAREEIGSPSIIVVGDVVKVGLRLEARPEEGANAPSPVARGLLG